MNSTNLSLTEFLSQISLQLDDAAAIARAAYTCATSGSEREALRIAMRLDTLLGDAVTLHAALCLIARIDRTSPTEG